VGVSGQYHQPVSAKAKTRNPKCPSVASAFGIRPSFGFRPSEFGFGRLATGGTFPIRPPSRSASLLLGWAVLAAFADILLHFDFCLPSIVPPCASFVVPVTNPVTHPEPAQRGFPSPLWDGFKAALGKLPGRLWGQSLGHQQAREPQGSLRVASGWLRGAYRLATREPEGSLRVASGWP